MLKFERRVLELDLYGESFKLRFPSVGESQEYVKKLEGLSEKEAGDGLVDFLDKLGLPKEKSMAMETEHLTQVIEALMPAKKK